MSREIMYLPDGKLSTQQGCPPLYVINKRAG